ncbi:MAG: RNA methyltransferase [Coprobacillus sp.]|nr:RNA methyltransferase [Coprobacillus sp.]
MITSIHNETIKSIMKLKQKKYRDEMNLFLIEGYHLVEEARRYDCIETIITTLDEKFEESTLYVSLEVMKKLAFTQTPQPIMAVCKKDNRNQNIIIANRYLLLDRVQDPGNVGTIIRTALALGVNQVIMSKDCVDLYNDKVIRATQGAIFQMNICIMDLKEAIFFLQKNHVSVYGTCLKNASSIDTYPPQERMAFIMGNEGQGISQEILDICNYLIYIPIHSIESLNVGVAAAITMYHFQEKI